MSNILRGIFMIIFWVETCKKLSHTYFEIALIDKIIRNKFNEMVIVLENWVKFLSSKKLMSSFCH